MHDAAYRALGLPHVYEKIETSAAELRRALLRSATACSASRKPSREPKAVRVATPPPGVVDGSPQVRTFNRSRTVD